MTTMAPAQHVITLVSGRDVAVMHPDEVTWFNQQRDQYLVQTKFTERTDLADLDRLLVMELMIYRWTVWIAKNTDYDGDMVDEERLRRNIKEYSDQINKIKDTMGLTKKSRDEAANDGNFSQWLNDLKARAKIFGVHREKQLTKALALFMELSTVIGAFDRADEEERRKIGFADEKAIVAWVRDIALPEYRELDEHFRANHQRYWVRDT
jgi:hypothetical protein